MRFTLWFSSQPRARESKNERVASYRPRIGALLKRSGLSSLKRRRIPQRLRRRLRVGVVDKYASARFATGQILEFIGGAVGRIEFDMKPIVVIIGAAAVRWSLVHQHDIGHRAIPEVVVLLHDDFKNLRQRPLFGGVEIDDGRTKSARQNMRLIGI